MQKKVYKESFWNLKDLLESHEGKEFDVVLADLEKKVKKAKIFTTVRSLLRSYNLKRIMPELNSEKNGKKNYINIRITKRKLKSLA